MYDYHATQSRVKAMRKLHRLLESKPLAYPTNTGVSFSYRTDNNQTKNNYFIFSVYQTKLLFISRPDKYQVRVKAPNFGPWV